MSDGTAVYNGDRPVAVRESDDPRRMQTLSLIRI